jgi:3-phosphoshikimate 1-carboxyvinyltransferase
MIERSAVQENNGEPVCDMKVGFTPSVLKEFPTEIGGDLLPNLIDEIPALAILGTRLSRGLRIVGAQELRQKESDRLHALAFNLGNLGVQVEESPDGLWIPPGQVVRGGRVKTFGDHRIAMAFSVAGLIAEQGVELDDPSCASVSFPDFYQALQSVSRGP